MSVIPGKTSAGLVAHCQMAKADKWGYAWALEGQILTSASQISSYPTDYCSNLPAYQDACLRLWKGQRVADCAGLIRSYLWWDGGKITPGPGEVGSAGFREAASQKGTIERVDGSYTFPDTPGLMVGHPGHIAVYIGNGKVIEAKGTNSGVVESVLTKTDNPRHFTWWAFCPWIAYTDMPSATDLANDSYAQTTTDDPLLDDEVVTPKTWTSYATGEYGAKATMYLERVRNLGVQTRRQEQLEQAKAKAEFFGEQQPIVNDADYTAHIEKWETILNSTPNAGLLSARDTTVTGQTTPYPPRDVGMTRVSYLTMLQDSLGGDKAIFQNSAYASIENHAILKDLYVPSLYDSADPWSGWARKDVLLYLYCLYQELDGHQALRGTPYAKLSVSCCRWNELKKPVSTRQTEHYVGVAADVYLPKNSAGVIMIDSKTVADILHTMGVPYIGIGADYVHFDLAGDEEHIWSIGGFPLYQPLTVDLNKTKSMTIPKEFR
jgi:hypothetical protein